MSSDGEMEFPNVADNCRYTMFYPLYPIGIGAEWWLLYRAIALGAKISPVIPPIFYFCLMLYIPGKYPVFVDDDVAYKRSRLIQDVHIHDQAKKKDTQGNGEEPMTQ
jgi:hypothetical protein